MSAVIENKPSQRTEFEADPRIEHFKESISHRTDAHDNLLDPKTSLIDRGFASGGTHALPTTPISKDFVRRLFAGEITEAIEPSEALQEADFELLLEGFFQSNSDLAAKKDAVTEAIMAVQGEYIEAFGPISTAISSSIADEERQSELGVVRDHTQMIDELETAVECFDKFINNPGYQDLLHGHPDGIKYDMFRVARRAGGAVETEKSTALLVELEELIKS